MLDATPLHVGVRVIPKLIPVFQGEARFRGAWGGRGSGKTRTFAKMAAVRALQFAQAGISGIILCGREYMNSLDESSMAEIKEAIREEYWLEANFEVGERFIRTRDHRVEFKFAGLRHNLDSIKSKSRILIAWVDEAEPVSEMAWIKLLPTVREDGSEVWITWNPETDGSATDNRFRKDPPPGAKIVEVNYTDNPWFPNVLKEMMEWDKARDPDRFSWIWEGGYNIKSERRVFRNYRVETFETPTDVERFYFGSDWGFSDDPSVLVRMFKQGRTIYFDQEAYELGCEIDYLPALFAGDCPETVVDERKRWENPHNWPGIEGAYEWPIIGDSSRPDTISHLRRRGFKIRGAKKGPGSVNEGVEFLKSHDIVIHSRCVHTKQEFATYSYKVDKNTEEVLPVLEDDNNHVIDSARYALEGTRRAQSNTSHLKVAGGKSAAIMTGGISLG